MKQGEIMWWKHSKEEATRIKQEARPCLLTTIKIVMIGGFQTTELDRWIDGACTRVDLIEHLQRVNGITQVFTNIKAKVYTRVESNTSLGLLEGRKSPLIFCGAMEVLW